jgi:hypothetical protein
MASVTSEGTLLDRLVEASGLSGVFARASIVRALERSGVDTSRLTRGDIKRALPEIERALSVFMAPPQVKKQLHSIELLLEVG